MAAKERERPQKTQRGEAQTHPEFSTDREWNNTMECARGAGRLTQIGDPEKVRGNFDRAEDEWRWLHGLPPGPGSQIISNWPLGLARLESCRVFLPALRFCAGRILPDATLDCSYVPHADHSTIGSNFCQAPVGNRISLWEPLPDHAEKAKSWGQNHAERTESWHDRIISQWGEGGFRWNRDIPPRRARI